MTNMPELNLIVGTGNTPKGYESFNRVYRLEKYRGVKRKIRLHLHGEWWTVISPEELRATLVNWTFNIPPPQVTISY